MQAEHAALRRIDDRSGKHRTVNTAVADREGSSLQLVHFELIDLRALSEVGDGFFVLRLIDVRLDHLLDRAGRVAQITIFG